MVINQTLTTNRKLLAIGIPIIVLCISIALAFSSYAAAHPELYIGITYDLILTAPLLCYFLSKRKMPKFVVGLFVSIGIITAYFVIPESEKFHFNLLRYVLLPLVELLIIGSIVYITYKTINGATRQPGERVDYLTAFQHSGVTAFKNELFGKLFGAELAMIHYAFFNWKSKPLLETEFSYYKKNGTTALLGGILMVLAIETLGVHFLLTKWSVVAAWIMTILSVYTFIMLLAHAKAVVRRPHTLHADALELKLGLFGTAMIPYHRIDRIDFTNKISATMKESACQFMPLGDMESFNTVVHLKEEVDCEFIYGIKRKYKTLLIAVDDKARFEQKIMQLIERSEM